MTEPDHLYFERRSIEEREAAERATHPTARESHLQLARRYEAAAAATGESLRRRAASASSQMHLEAGEDLASNAAAP